MGALFYNNIEIYIIYNLFILYSIYIDYKYTYKCFYNINKEKGI